METVTVRMARGDRNQSWGFGVTEAPNRDVVIVNIVGGSLAERAGLRDGDVISELEGLRDLDINAVDRLLVTSREKIELVIYRNSGGQTRIWRPEITENTDMRAVFSGNPPPVEQRPYKVSLEHHSDIRAPQGFNSAAAPFEPADPRVKHLQYNSPMGLYSSKNVEESYRQQTACLSGQSGQHPSGNSQPGYMQSETLRLIKEQDHRGGGGGSGAAPSLSSHPNPSGLPVCFVCTRPILGVMAQAAGHQIHGDCLSCATCGNTLRNVGHHFIDNKFYCEIHGRQKKGLAPITLDPNLAVRSSPTAAQPVRNQEGIRGFYQPEILSRAPISPGTTHTSTGHSQVNVHVSNPKTQGTISPQTRGVPLNPNYGGTGSNYSSQSNYAPSYESQRPVSPRPAITVAPPPPIAAPPPPPSNPPPGSSSHSQHSLERPTSSLSIVSTSESRVPSSVRDAVSPRRASRAPRPWPPPETGVKNRYWQIDPVGAAKREREPEPCSLQEMIQKDEKSTNHSNNAKNRNRRLSKIDSNDVKKAFQRLEKKPETAKDPPVQSYIVSASAIRREEKEPPRGSSTPQQHGDIFPMGVHGFAPIPPADLEEPKKPEINNGIHWTVITGPKSPSRTPPPNVTQIRIEQPLPQRPEPQRPTELPQTLRVEPARVDSSTSPIPVIRFERQKSLERPRETSPTGKRLPYTSSPIPFQAPKIEHRPPTPPLIRLPQRSPISPSSELGDGNLIGVNMAPKPFGIPPGSPKKIAKPLKKVDFSKAEFIPSPIWENEVVDESDMLTVTSRNSDDDSIADNPRVSYDADESITTNGEEEELMDEQERWMKEELELAMKEELEMKKLEQKWREQEEQQRRGEEISREETPIKAAGADWKEQAAALLGDEEQSERDLAMVAALHDRLSGLREMEDVDRQRAIECIERHQKALEEQQEQLAGLLQSAIVYLRQMEPEETVEIRHEDKAPTPPPRNSSIVKTDSLNEALEELDAIKLSAGEKITKELEKVQSEIDEARKVSFSGSQQQTTFSRSTFEKTSTNENKSNGIAHRGGAATHNTASYGGRIPYCEACKQQIKGAFVLATGLAWCPEHFVCANRSCGRRLLECGFVEEAGQKYCEGCFETHIAPRCAKCAKPITSDCLNALHKKWHPTCFTCAHCHKPFGNSAFYLENGQPYCEHDWNQLFTTKCSNCKYPIEAGDRWVEALGSAFHSNCFNCSRCQTNLEGESFYAKNGQPFCKMHA